jgi:hypothetical protein
MIVEISYIINHSDSRLTFQSINKRLESRARCGSQKGASQPASAHIHTKCGAASSPTLSYLALSVCSSGRPSCNDNGNGTACVKTGLKVHLCDRLTPPGGGGRIRAGETSCSVTLAAARTRPALHYYLSSLAVCDC